MTPLHHLPAWPNGQSGQRCQVVIESALGGRVKYKFEPDLGVLSVRYLLPCGFIFPFNFGFIPSTLGEDGDPLDILILDEVPLVCGCILQAELLAVIKVRQTRRGKVVSNNRLVGRIGSDGEGAESRPPDHRLLSRWSCFLVESARCRGRTVEIAGLGGRREAWRLLRQGAKHFQKAQ